MARYSAPLLIAATTYFMTLPAPARAHGLSSLAAGCANAYRFFCNQAVALQRPRLARSHPHQSHRSWRRDFFVLGVAMAEQRGGNGS
jgi:hypothetical protein